MMRTEAGLAHPYHPSDQTIPEAARKPRTRALPMDTKSPLILATLAKAPKEANNQNWPSWKRYF